MSNKNNNEFNENNENITNQKEKSKIKNENIKQNELDWKELEKWNNLKEMKEEDIFGIDIKKLDIKELEKDKKKVEKMTKILGIIVKTLYIIGKGAVILAIIIGLLWALSMFNQAGEMMGA